MLAQSRQIIVIRYRTSVFVSLIFSEIVKDMFTLVVKCLFETAASVARVCVFTVLFKPSIWMKSMNTILLISFTWVHHWKYQICLILIKMMCSKVGWGSSWQSRNPLDMLVILAIHGNEIIWCKIFLLIKPVQCTQISGFP